MPGKKHGPELKDPAVVRGAAPRGREQGEGGADRQRVGRLVALRRSAAAAATAEDLDERTTRRAAASARRELGIEGRSKMSKRELISAIRNH